MGFLNSLKEFFNPHIVDQFNWLYDNYYEALKLYIYGGYQNKLDRILETKLPHFYLSRNMPYDDKKFLVESQEYIINSYNRELEYREALKLANECSCGFALICYKELNITVSDVPPTAKKIVSDYIHDTIFSLDSSPLTLCDFLNQSRRKHETLTLDDTLLYSSKIVSLSSKIIEEERNLKEKILKIQDAENKQIINSAKHLALFYPKGYKQYVNFPTDTMSLDQAKKTLSYESHIKEYELLLRDRETMPQRLQNAVCNWETIKGIPYYFFYYYYPSRFSDISSESKNARKMIWNFKDGHNQDKPITLIKKKLSSTFKSNDLKEMTFVCIPASTNIANRIRYKEFSNRICSELGMRNAFEYITITKEKKETHLGGTDKSEFSFDYNFFNGAYVVLFDDVVTKGHSMEDFKNHLISYGATIVCAISIGRTYSDYNGNNPKPHPHTNSL